MVLCLVLGGWGGDGGAVGWVKADAGGAVDNWLLVVRLLSPAVLRGMIDVK